VTLWQQLRHLLRVSWELGGPLGILVFKLDGTLDERIADVERRLGA
jgi:hypothetical protein